MGEEKEAQGSSGEDPRRTAILEAAAELFFQRGFNATSVDAIIEKAGGSKRTIYAEFGNKQGLFEALIHEHTRDLFALVLPDLDGLPLRDSLISFARQLLRLFSHPRTVGVFRLVVAESGRFPELADAFVRLGPGRGRDWLEERLTSAQQRGEIHYEDSAVAASQFLALVRSDIYFEFVLGMRDKITEDEIDRRSRQAVDFFLNAMKPR